MNSLAAFSVPQDRIEHRASAHVDENAAAPSPPRSFGVSNPTRGTGEVRFSLPSATHLSIAVFDLLGRRMATLLDRASLGAGDHRITLPCEQWPAGVYLCRLTESHATAITKFVVVR